MSNEWWSALRQDRQASSHSIPLIKPEVLLCNGCARTRLSREMTYKFQYPGNRADFWYLGNRHIAELVSRESRGLGEDQVQW